PSLFWFRMDMMIDFIRSGYEVYALGNDNEDVWKQQFTKHNIIYKQIKFHRNGLNPISDFISTIHLISLIKDIKPDKIFIYQAKTIIYGSIAAKVAGVYDVYSLVAGLGSIFRGNGFKNSVIRALLKVQYKIACCFNKAVFFQNDDDRREFVNNRIIAKNKTIIINGSGVNLEKFKPTALPDTPAFLFIGRLIKDKGIIEYLEACKRIKEEYPQTRCLLVGPFDSNPTSLKPADLDQYIANHIVEYYGEQNDVRPFISQCSVFVLPSYYEGTPKTVLESMAMARAIITTDAPGCRETVINGVNGFLVNIKNIEDLVDKMKFCIINRDITKKMGEESLRIAIEKYDVTKVNHQIQKTMNIKKADGV
ncbi:MAG TPA: glycosyltransferase family 1 protein, partial [Ruminococcaceae bacterium]|nr:glycosyltransferase family 1 protein [Oscillospiraceae bacterium]